MTAVYAVLAAAPHKTPMCNRVYPQLVGMNMSLHCKPNILDTIYAHTFHSHSQHILQSTAQLHTIDHHYNLHYYHRNYLRQARVLMYGTLTRLIERRTSCCPHWIPSMLDTISRSIFLCSSRSRHLYTIQSAPFGHVCTVHALVLLVDNAAAAALRDNNLTDVTDKPMPHLNGTRTLMMVIYIVVMLHQIQDHDDNDATPMCYRCTHSIPLNTVQQMPALLQHNSTAPHQLAATMFDMTPPMSNTSTFHCDRQTQDHYRIAAQSIHHTSTHNTVHCMYHTLPLSVLRRLRADHTPAGIVDSMLMVHTCLSPHQIHSQCRTIYASTHPASTQRTPHCTVQLDTSHIHYTTLAFAVLPL
jgi:hypothetical protein